MRHHLLIAYDIADPKRLRLVHRLVRSYGDAVQYSVYLGMLSEKDEAILREKLRDIIHHLEDQVIFIRLGGGQADTPTMPSHWTVVGRKIALVENRLLIY